MVIGVAICGCNKEAPKESASGSSASGNPITAPVDYLGAVAKAQQSAVRIAGNAQLTQAIKMFQAEEGRYPTNLQELVAKRTLPALPALPANMKFDYNPTNGDVKVSAKTP
jgi:hypothetical protein